MSTIHGLPRPLARALEGYANRLDVDAIQRAHDLAVSAHAGQTRASGEEYVSHTIEVATIRIPRQTFDGAARQAFCENLSFTPWHSLPEHRPLGGINRVRRAVYLAVSTLRHRLNQAPRAEPTGIESFP